MTNAEAVDILRGHLEVLDKRKKGAAAIKLAIEAVENAGYTVCSYCGDRRPRSDQEGMLEHILTCPKRPEARLLDAMLDSLIRIEASFRVELRSAFLTNYRGIKVEYRGIRVEARVDAAIDRIKAAGALSFTRPEGSK